MVGFRHLRASLCAIAVGTGIGSAPLASALPQGFVDQVVSTDFDQATGLVFAPDGRAFIWEKAGRVWLFENGLKSAQPLIDIREEVGNWRDYGLLGFAIDPDFAANGRIYLSYVVDYHHLKFFGTPQYDPGTSTDFHDTIGRITRYTCNAADGFRSVSPASRTILLGESISTGIPIMHQSHGVGSLLFGRDGSLFASCGDGASYDEVDAGGTVTGGSNTALADGIISPKENVGAFRSQMVDSLSGKILRLDPATGNGLPTNPYFDPAAPRAARSRVWALGLRNPFRMAIVPHDDGPGVLIVGDVGWNDREEINVVHEPGTNFGWPLFEGYSAAPGYAAAAPCNLDAPNPLAGTPGCPVSHFTFAQLLIEETHAAPSWPNPCNPSLQIPASIPRFIHSRPVIDWGHDHAARIGIAEGAGVSTVDLGDSDSPVSGNGFSAGSASTGGTWYDATAFPAAYRGTYFSCDFTGGWIKNFVFDDDHRLVAVRSFVDNAGAVALAVNPVDGALYFLDYDENAGPTRLRRVIAASDLPPTAAASASVAFGPLPLAVSFSSAGTLDPESRPLTYSWDFGDGTFSTDPNPLHVYQGDPTSGPRRYDVTLLIIDEGGNVDSARLPVSANNTPPSVTITSPADGSLFSMLYSTTFPLTAAVSDVEHDPAQRTCRWQTVLHHNTHTHPEPSVAVCNASGVVTPVGCDGQTYFFEFRLTVTDALGLSTTRSVNVYPNCCRGDFNNDGQRTPSDIFTFLTAYFTSAPGSDFNADGLRTPADIFAFLNAYFAGC